MVNNRSRIDKEIAESAKTHKLNLSGARLGFVPELLSGLTHVLSLDLSNNKLRRLDASMLPPSLESLIVSNNLLTELDFSKAPKSLSVVYANSNRLKSVVTQGSCIKYLLINGNNIAKMPAFGAYVSTVQCSKNQITEFESLNNVSVLNCSENRLKKLELTPNFKKLDASANPLESLTGVPKCIEYVVVSNTRLTDPCRIDSNILFARVLKGLPDNLIDTLKTEYGLKIKAIFMAAVARRKYTHKLVMRDLNELFALKPSFNKKVLNAYFVNAKAPITRRIASY